MRRLTCGKVAEISEVVVFTLGAAVSWMVIAVCATEMVLRGWLGR